MTDLISKWQSGDASAFETFYRQYERLVFKDAYLITGSLEEAEDVLQEVFISVWKSRRTYKPERGKVTTWLHKITVNKCLERKRKKRLSFMSFEKLEYLAEIQDGQEEKVMQKQAYEIVMQAMSSLDRNHRAVLVLRYFNEFTYEEIAHALSIPLGTVKSRIHKALILLRGQLAIEQNEVSM